MPWWVTLLLILAGVVALSIVMILPFGCAWGSAIGEASRRAGNPNSESQ